MIGREMTEDETYIFIALSKATPSIVNNLFEDMNKKPGGWVLKAIEKRFAHYDLELDKRIMILILSFGDGIVGKCAKYVDDIFQKSKSFG